MPCCNHTDVPMVVALLVATFLLFAPEHPVLAQERLIVGLRNDSSGTMSVPALVVYDSTQRAFVRLLHKSNQTTKPTQSFPANAVEWVEPDYVGSASSADLEKVIPDDPFFHLQWYLNNDGNFPFAPSKAGADIRISDAWGITMGDSTITVAILDSGIDVESPEFAGRFWKNPKEIPDDGIDNDNNGYVDDVIGWDFVNGDNDPADEEGHGTAVAAILAADFDNGTGIAGVDQRCKIMVCKVLGSTLSGYYSDWVEAIYYAVENGARIINFSMAGEEPSKALEDAIDFANAKGVLVVVGMGNKNSSKKYYPAAYTKTLAVGATDPTDERTRYFNGEGGLANGSNFGPHLDVVAPGNFIATISLDSEVSMRSGTSMSVPIVSGIASLLLAQDKSRTVDELVSIICQSAVDLAGDAMEEISRWDPYHGFGRVDAFRALTYNVTPNLPAIGVHVFPNPAFGQFDIDIAGPEATHVDVSIYNSFGKEVKSFSQQEVRASRFSIDTRFLVPGAYFIIVKTGKERVVRRVYVGG